MATRRTYIDPITGTVITFNANRTYMSPFGSVISEGKLTVVSAFDAWLTTFNTSAKMKKNVAGQSVGAQMITISDGSVFTGSVTVLITIDNGTQSASAGTAPAHEGNGYHSYTPTQAETNGDHIAFTFTGTGAVTQTIQVETTFPQSVDNDVLLQLTATATDLATAQNDLDTITGSDGVTLATAQALYAPSKAGDSMNISSIDNNAITALSIAASALDGKGNWNIGKTGYSLIQTFPANFNAMVISATGDVNSDLNKINTRTITGDGSASPFDVL